MSYGAVPTITTPGSVISYNATSANVAVPLASSGQAPNYVRLAATSACYVRLGVGAGTTAVAGDMLVQPADAIVVRSIGLTHIAALQVTTAGVLQISPLENV